MDTTGIYKGSKYMFEFIKNLFRRKKDMNRVAVKELELIIRNFLGSKELKKMQLGDNYYKGKHDILNRVRKVIGQDGNLVPAANLPNNKIVDNMFANAVDQKTDYLLSKTPSLSSKNEKDIENLNKIFNSKFFKLLHSIGKGAYLNGIAFLYVYYNEKSKFSFKKFKGSEVIPIWKDDDHTELDYVIRIYNTKKFTGFDYKEVTNVEVYTLSGINYYTWSNGLSSLIRHENYMKLGDKEFNWEYFPVIPFKVDETEVPLIIRVKSIQDAINEIISDFKNAMDEDSRTTILVIKNYNGQGGTLRHNMNLYGYIPVAADGGVDKLTIEVNADNYETILKILKKSFIENAKAFDAKSEKLQGNVNQMNIQSMYSDIDLDATALEREFKASLKMVLWFVKQHLKANFNEDDIDIIFNKDILINESQAIEDCQKSVGILSTETIVAQHPWVNDSKAELEKIKKEKQDPIEKIEEVYEGHNHE